MAHDIVVIGTSAAVAALRTLTRLLPDDLHASLLRTLKEAHEARAEARPWAAMQAFEENVDVNRRLAREARARGDEKEANGYDTTTEEILRRVKLYRHMLQQRG